MAWQNSEKLSQTLEATFNNILNTRMQDMPVLNLELSVQALGFNRYQQDWLGILITPWFMNLLLLPESDGTWSTQHPGSKFSRGFPYGVFEFTVANEAELGTYAQCSLFSPMFEFTDQAAAVLAAQAALKGLLSFPAPKTVSRRDLLRGNLTAGHS